VLWKRLFGSETPRPKSHRSRKLQRAQRPRRLSLESLETRATPTAALLYDHVVEEVMEQAPALVPGTAFYLAKMRADGSFTDLNYSGATDASANDLLMHGKRLELLSLAYKWNDAGNSYLGSQALKGQILQGWNYVATRGGVVNAPNWWWKAIGVPQGMSQGLILMRDEMSATLRGQVLNKYFPSGIWNPSKYDGANLTYQAPIAIIDGLLRGNTARISEVVGRVSGELLAYGGDGIQRDLSFYQHNLNGRYNYYSGHYGLQFAQDTAQIMRWTAGTDFAFGTPAVDQEVRFLLDHLQWLTRGDTFDVASMGRMITAPNHLTAAAATLRDAMVDMLPLGRRADELWSAIDRYENGVSETNFLSGNQSLWRSDAMAHQRPEMMTTLKLLSSRTLRPETAAGNNMRGFFEGDGFTLFVQDGDELGARWEQDILPVWDWQRVPGTTVQHNGVIPAYDMFKSSTNSTGSSNLVGSASDGRYGVALMDYRRGGVSLTAKKSWFFFDNEVVALGADIDDLKANSPVFTSLNQVLLDGPVTVQDAAGRRTLDLGTSASLNGAAWIHHDDLGYVILDGSNRTTVQAKTQSGGGVSLPVFSAWVDHGARPQNKTYAYAVVPGVSPDELDQFAANAPIQILANTPTVQTVRHTGLQQTQVAFFSAGTTWINNTTWVTVNQPALLMIREVGDDLVITAADPRQTAASLTIDLNRRLIGAGASWQAQTQTTRIVMQLPAAPDRGASVTRTYSNLVGASLLLPAEADTFVRNGIYVNYNYGASQTLPVQSYNAGYSREILVRFDTSQVAGEIVYAEVRLLALAGTSPTTPVTVAAAPLLSDAWDEALATWNARPASGGEIGRVSVKQGQFAAFDVTNLVRDAVADDNRFSLRLFGPAWSYYSATLGSRENPSVAYQPVLEVFTRALMVDPPAEGESPSRHITLAEMLAVPSEPQVFGPLRLSDFLASSALKSTFGPLPAPLAAPIAPAPSSTDRRYASPSSLEPWRPEMVDLALTDWLEPEPDSVL